MKTLLSKTAVTLGLLVGLAGTAGAQVFTPTYSSPRLVNEIGVHASQNPGNVTLEGIWRGGPLGLRLGFVNGTNDLISVGGELRNPIRIPGAPLGLAFTAGAQALVGDVNALGVQAGVSAGYTFVGSGMALTPYIHPRVGLINHLGGTEDLEFEVLADVGADLEFWNNLLVRIGFSLDEDSENWGFGIGWRR